MQRGVIIAVRVEILYLNYERNILTKMIEKRSSSIHKKVIRPTDIVQLANVFNRIYEELLSKHNEDVKNKIISEYTSKPSVSFHLESVDGIEYSTDNLELFQQDGVIYKEYSLNWVSAWLFLN